MTTWPRLSDTLPSCSRDVCNNCRADADLTLWQEHDDNDKPELRFVWLCARCSDTIIEPHPRLYDRVDTNAPAPGAMTICTSCRHRIRLRCMKTKEAGGEGVVITASKPMTAFVDGVDKQGRRRGWVAHFYSLPPTACSQFSNP